ncbi:acyltransferase family protein [Tateyamaria omphalii]|uniref:acyltransferase family protein n=1 Tax=Tateyamaria omphalii TaxID=299262 RepID=UPI001675F59A|nr:acyltransferase [Tateyamaria omphalii]
MSSFADNVQTQATTYEDRLASFDLLRFLASFGIVWAHTLGASRPLLASVGYEALSLFCILIAYFSVKSVQGSKRSSNPGKNPQTSRTWLLHLRVGRLAIPWLFWCAFYLLVTAMIAGDFWSIFIIEDPLSLLVGPLVHLWFLPFALIASGGVLILTRRLNTSRRVAVGSVISAIVSVALYRVHDLGLAPVPFAQWAFAIPCFLFGTLVALGERHGSEAYAWVLFVLVCLVFLPNEELLWPVHLLITVMIFGAAKVVRISSNAALVQLGSLAMGIYLIHPFFMAVVFKFLGTEMDPILTAIAVFALSAIAIQVMQRLPGIKRVV